jgi:DNA-binding Lrp family transcriptional regulator
MLDDTDRHLLSLLQANARESAATLARKLGGSHHRGGAHRTLGAGRCRGGVWRAAGAPPRAGRRARVLRAERQREELRHGAQAAGAHAGDRRVSAVSGLYDYLVFLRCETHEQLDALLDQLGQIDGINQTHTSVILSRKLDRRSAVACGM